MIDLKEKFSIPMPPLEVWPLIADPSVVGTLPLYEWFTADVANSTTRTGTRASVFFNGEFFDNVFVRVRGSATTVGAPEQLSVAVGL